MVEGAGSEGSGKLTLITSYGPDLGVLLVCLCIQTRGLCVDGMCSVQTGRHYWALVQVGVRGTSLFISRLVSCDTYVGHVVIVISAKGQGGIRVGLWWVHCVLKRMNLNTVETNTVTEQNELETQVQNASGYQ